MAQVEVLMPKMGESVFEATVTKWLKKEGESVSLDECIVEIATDKVDSEVPSTAEGILYKRLCNEGDVIQVGKPLAIITTPSKNDSENTNATPTVSLINAAADKEVKTTAPLVKPQSANEIKKEVPAFISPLVKNIAKAEGIPLEDLTSLKGSGLGGRITKKDILEYIPNKSKPVTAPAISLGGEDEIIEMDRMRKLISDHMIMSKHTSAHVTSFVEADVTNVVLWRDKIKNNFEQTEGEKLTFTPIFIEAIARAIKEFPMINVSVDGNKIIRHKHIHIGMATALPSGNLIVPVIKDADTLSLVGLTKKVNDLANRARNNKLTPDEIQGGTYTITNVGSFGNVMGTPIINQPQVAIMALGVIKKKPAVIETPQGDLIGIRHMMYLSHTYDHRVIDGSLGGQFVRRVADILENWNPDKSY